MGTVTVDDFNIGSRASVAGGTTSFIDFIFTLKISLKLSYDIQYQKSLINLKVGTISFHALENTAV